MHFALGGFSGSLRSISIWNDTTLSNVQGRCKRRRGIRSLPRITSGCSADSAGAETHLPWPQGAYLGLGHSSNLQVPSATGKVSSNTLVFVKLRMEKLL